MYLTFFGLSETPFSLTPDPRHLYRGESFVNAWSRLTEWLDRGGGLAVLLGESGIGKTLFSVSLQTRFADLSAVVRIDPGLTAEELVVRLHDALRVPLPVLEGDERGLLDELIEFIEVREQKGERTVIVIDEAHNLRLDMLRHLQSLLRLGEGVGKPRGLVLIGQREMQSLLDDAARSGVLGRESVRCELRPFTERETIDYIGHRLAIAGAVKPIFTKAARVFVHRVSRGVPRLINSICSHALLAAQMRSEPVVTARIIRSVAGDVPLVDQTETSLQRFKGALARRGLEIWSDGLYHVANMWRGRGSFSPLTEDTSFARVQEGSLNHSPAKRANDDCGDLAHAAALSESAARAYECLSSVIARPGEATPSSFGALPERSMGKGFRGDFGTEAASARDEPVDKSASPARQPGAVKESPQGPLKRAAVRVRPSWRDIPEDMVYIAEMRLESAYGRQIAVVGGFLMDRTPITNEAYRRFIEDTGHRAPEYWFKGRPPPSVREHPVVGVSFQDAERYARWCGKRLPTAAEWEAAARSPDNRRYPWGGAWEPVRCNGPDDGPGQSTPVGAYPEGASVDGCQDLIGNVWEWTVADDPAEQQDGDYAWVFGGSFRHEGSARDAIARTRVMRSQRFSYLGFRCAGNVP